MLASAGNGEHIEPLQHAVGVVLKILLRPRICAMPSRTTARTWCCESRTPSTTAFAPARARSCYEAARFADRFRRRRRVGDSQHGLGGSGSACRQNSAVKSVGPWRSKSAPSPACTDAPAAPHRRLDRNFSVSAAHEQLPRFKFSNRATIGRARPARSAIHHLDGERPLPPRSFARQRNTAGPQLQRARANPRAKSSEPSPTSTCVTASSSNSLTPRSSRTSLLRKA